MAGMDERAAVPGSAARAVMLARLWRRNWRIGWPERARGLHYWLGFEYAMAAMLLRATPGQRWLDVGTGAWSVLPYVLADLADVEVVAVDVDADLRRQVARRRRAATAHLGPERAVQLVRADARDLPFADATFDGVTAISTLEHVVGTHGDRQALSEAARVLKPGGQAIVTVPFRAAGSVVELGRDLGLYQRHYSPETLTTSLLGPSGLAERTLIWYGERLAFYRLSRRLPLALDWIRRPWDSLLSVVMLHPVNEPTKASAVLCDLFKPPRNAQDR